MTVHNTPLKNKWKRFVAHHHFSGWGNHMTAEELFDYVIGSSKEDAEVVFEDYKVVISQPYKMVDYDNLAEGMLVMAQRLQEIENEN